MRKVLITITLFFLLPATLLAVIPDIKFRRLDTRDGLSNLQALCVLRDSKGFVWIGTPYGLNRYDGYRVKTYFSDMPDSTSLRSNYVGQIFEAFDGKLWMNHGMGYSVFDPSTEKCNRHPEQWLEKQGVSGGIEYLYIDSEKNFWVKTYSNGFWKYNPVTKVKKQLPSGYAEHEFNTEMGISSFAEHAGMLYISSVNGEILCIDKEKCEILFKENYLSKNGLTHDQECKLRLDKQGNIWMLTIQATYVFDRKTRQWYHSAQDALRSWGFTNVPAEMAIWDMLVDSKDRYWIATDHGGLYVLDMRDMLIKQFLTDKHDENTISDNTLRNLYCDALERIWIGTYMGGVNLYAGNLSSFRNIELGNINTLCYDRNGISWLGTNDAGIIRYDNRSGEGIVFNKENSGIGSNTMVGALAASDGSVWFGTYEGGLIHIKNGHATSIKATGDTLGLANNNVWTVFEDRWHNIWVGTLGGGVQRIDKRTGLMKSIRMSNSIISSDFISTITGTKKGWLMVAHSKFFSLINPKTMHVVNYDLGALHPDQGLTEMSICGMEDSRELAWLGTTSGATIFDRKSGRIWQLTMKSGLFGSTVNSIVEDDKHTMWVVTDHGISNVVLQKQDDGDYTFIVRSYNNRDGLQNGPYNQRSACFTKVGLILVGGHGGLDILNPKNMGKGRMEEVPLFSGLQIFDQDISVGEEVDGRVILKEALNDCRSLTLRYYQPFTIQLGSTSGEIHNRSRFVYRLEGFNSNWVKTSEQNPNISYMSLSPGSYTLCVRMLNDDGTYGDQESRLDITITAPIYKSWWANLLYILIGGALVFLWYRRMKRRHAERMELERVLRETEKQQWMREMEAKMQDRQVLRQQQEEQMSYSPEVDELVGFVKQTVESFKMPADKPCRVSFLSSLNRLTMLFDSALLKQLLDTLLLNAVKFSPRGSRIKVTLGKVGNLAEIRVADRGLGIPESAREHMFEDSTIGLDVVKQIAELHGGAVRAEDNPHGGTIFVVLLSTEFPQSQEDDIPIEDAVLMDDEEGEE